MTSLNRVARHVQFRIIWLLLFVLAACLSSPPAHSSSRIAHFLPDIALNEIFPTATHTSEPAGTLPVAKVFKDQEQLGYVYVTTDIVNTRGYSSFPIDTLVAMSMDGSIVAAKLLEHHEPIVLIGIPESRVEAFIQGYVGQNYIKNRPKPGAPPPVDIISGATVTLMVVGDSIMRSSQLVARQEGIGQPAAPATAPAAVKRSIDSSNQTIASWDELLQSGAIQRLHVSVADINQAFIDSGRTEAAAHPQEGDPQDTFIDLYAALVSVPSIGKSLLGESDYTYLQQELKPGQQAMLVVGNGLYSFKGSGYVRGGIFDRIEIVQDLDSFHFTDLDHQRLPGVKAANAPDFKEAALFKIPATATFDPVQPWRLQLLVQRVLSVKDKAFVTLNLNYQLPDAYLTAPPPAAVAAAPDAAAHDDLETASEPLYKQIWAGKKVQIAVLLLSLLTLGGVFFFQDTLTKHEVFYQRFRIGFLLFSLVWIGWYASAQLSVVNVLTFSHALRTDFRWEYFLMDPLVFILWIATAISLIFWNRGAFCGWLCPFGALQELANKLARFLRIPQIKVAYSAHKRLVSIKYVIFILLFGFALYDMAVAEKMAEVEPFKTAIILKFIRDWPFTIFAVLLLIASLFIERFYCRYLCALGAALAIPARLRIFDWLRRYPMCGNPCQRCASDCPVQAIEPEGPINPNECIQCLNCQMLYHHEKKCPHLIQKIAKRKRDKPAPVAVASSLQDDAAARPTVRPRSVDSTDSTPATP
ncbi:NosR/NirI family protein [Alcaligenes nematophilus]|uniref:4Fe-4S binding protein n=1 Tax=Alcaligenes nematophilus TaxID=2994643 RepID=UPI002AA30A88|nr:4Fe-4S binding protein [Alcaligenes phenolicus]